MSFLNLQPDLLQIIIANSCSDGFKALIQTRKEVYQTAAGSDLDEHNRDGKDSMNLLEPFAGPGVVSLSCPCVHHKA